MNKSISFPNMFVRPEMDVRSHLMQFCKVIWPTSKIIFKFVYFFAPMLYWTMMYKAHQEVQ